MKKFMIIVFLLLCGVGFGINPVFVKDQVTEGSWRLFIPADDAGVYWSRWDFTWAKGGYNAYDHTIAINDVFYGIVRPGICIAAGATGWTDTGNLWAGTTNNYSYRSTDLTSEIATIAIPANYNRISVFILATSSTGLLAVDWSDGTTAGIDNTLITSQEASTSVKEYLITENSAGSKTLRLKCADDTGNSDVRIIAVRAFNTNAIGDPSTATAGITDGHDFINTYKTTTATAWAPLFEPAGGVVRVQDGDNKALLWALSFAPNGSSLRFTGSDSHYGTGEASLVWDTSADPDWATNGMTIYENGVDKGEIWDVTANPLGTLYTGDSVSLYAEGFSDYDDGGTQDGADPDVKCNYAFSSSGITSLVTLEWKANTDTGKVYCPIAQCYTTGTASYVMTPPSATKTYLYDGVGEVDINGYSYAEYYPQGQAYNIKMLGCMPAKEILFSDDSSNKLYAWGKVEALDGGVNPQSGDTWAIGGLTSVQKTKASGGKTSTYTDTQKSIYGTN